MVKTTKFSLTLSWYTSHWLGNCFSSEFTEEGCNTTLSSDLQRSKKIPQKLPPNLGFTLLMVRGRPHKRSLGAPGSFDFPDKFENTHYGISLFQAFS